MTHPKTETKPPRYYRRKKLTAATTVLLAHQDAHAGTTYSASIAGLLSALPDIRRSRRLAVAWRRTESMRSRVRGLCRDSPVGKLPARSSPEPRLFRPALSPALRPPGIQCACW